jgi:aryl-alcohol dehydrogenase-like predicted oxidoreductase
MLRKSVEQSLAKLQRTSIDLLFIHEPDRPLQYQWWNDGRLEDSAVLRLVDELKREGIVRYLGLGGTTAYELARLIETDLFDVVLTAANYSLLWREAQIELLPAARRHKVGVIAGTPLQQGALARRYDTEIRDGGASWLSKPRREQFMSLYRFLDAIEIPIGELALRFMLSCPDIDCVLTGARSSAEVEENVRSIEKGPLADDILTGIEEIAAVVPFRPYEEPTVLPFGRRREGPGMLR